MNAFQEILQLGSLIKENFLTLGEKDVEMDEQRKSQSMTVNNLTLEIYAVSLLGTAALIIIKANIGYLLCSRYSCSVLITTDEMGTLSSPISQIKTPRNREET